MQFSVVFCQCPTMVQLQYFPLLILWTCSLPHINTEPAEFLSSEESKKVLVKAKKIQRENFHCDLNLLPAQKKMMYVGYTIQKREVSFDMYRWPKDEEGFVIVPYRIARSSRYSEEQKSLIRNAMDAIERDTCIRFKVRKQAPDFVNIYSGKYCRSNLGRTGGAQDMSLNTFRCFQKGIIIHELMHALGYIHMHNRPDRDKYVKIIWNNIKSEFSREFEKVSPGLFNYYGTPYDYYSIMHYGSKAASRNGGKTIVTRDDTYSDTIGQRSGLSEGDIRRINTKYKCKTNHYKVSSNVFTSYSSYGHHHQHDAPEDHVKHRSEESQVRLGDDDDDDDLFKI